MALRRHPIAAGKTPQRRAPYPDAELNSGAGLPPKAKTRMTSEGDNAQVVVFSGEVTARQNKSAAIVPTGYGAIIIGQNAPQLFAIDWAKAMQIKVLDGVATGSINPLNRLFLNGKPVEIVNGQFSVKLPGQGNGDVFTVIDALENRRSFPQNIQ